ncbi:7160_t:CDS:2 [Scutellospora calospora]|uniref:7160_t:CDS:1 n=1 Tax=Scutellospora calospora TaxID=85575 RepID=A0ACA9JU03_9GLOM|nr:7160_t:CDS:2 [Scutellospora calospora]
MTDSSHVEIPIEEATDKNLEIPIEEAPDKNVEIPIEDVPYKNVEIPIEEAPDKSVEISIEEIKKISKIVCSPNMKYVAALDEGSNISIWTIVNNEKLLEKHIKNNCTKEKDRLFAISDNMHTSIGLDRDHPYNFKIFNFNKFDNEKYEKEELLTFPDSQKEIDILSFTDNGRIVMVNNKFYRAYVFSSEDNKWICESMIELKYFNQIYITLKGKLIIFNDTIYEITVWDIETLSVATRTIIEWNYTIESIEISDNEELLLICAKSEETKETRLYVFSTETGINLAFFNTKYVIDRFHLIASKKGERLLFVLDDPPDKQYNIMDPYHLTNAIDASEFFENDQIQEPYVIQSDKIIYMTDGNLSIKDLVPNNSDDWMKYLRKELKDTNSITTPSEKTTKIIKNILNNKYNKYISDNEEFEGHYFKWGLELGSNSVMLTVTDFNHRKKNWNPNNKKNRLEILPSFHKDQKKFIAHCEVLDNDDFIMITRIGVIIWTFKFSKANKTKEIKLHYYWNDCNSRLENFVSDHNGSLKEFDFSDLKFEDRFKNWTSARILPASSYETIYKNLDIKFGNEQLFEQFLKDNIFEEFYLICYGKNLMKTFISVKDDKWIRSLGGSCVDKCMQDNNHLIFKIPLLSIIFENFVELSENHPAFIASILSTVAFIAPTTKISSESTSSHLSSYGRYCHLSRTSYFDIITSNLFDHFNSFQNNFQKFQTNHPLFRKFIVKLYENLVKPVKEFYYTSYSSTVLAIPLPNFVSYSKVYNSWKEFILPKPNCFTYSNKLEMINEEFYRYLNGEALLKFKWNTYGRKYYLAIWFIYTVFLCSFIIAATFDKTISQLGLSILLNISIFLGIWHLIFEVRQVIFAPLTYMSSAWNWFDLGAFLLPMITSIIWLQNDVMPIELATFSTLLLEIKFLCFFRAIKFSGTYFSMILGVAKKGFSFLMILGFIIFAFAHSLHLLLRPATSVSLDYPSYSTDPNDPWNLAATYNSIDPNGTIEESSSLIEPPTATTNMFMMMGTAISAVYIMLTGDTSPISYWDLDSNPTLLLITMIFSFVATIYLMNLFIGLLSNAIGDTSTSEAFLILKAEVLEEIELLYMLPHQRRKENWFPFVIFYECRTIELREYVIDIQKNWKGYKKPYFSKNLTDVLLLPKEQPDLAQIDDQMKKQAESIKELKDSYATAF